MAKNNAIVELEGSDIISESMHKINDNFRILAEKEEQDTYKWDSYIKRINEELEKLKLTVDSRNIDISKIIESFGLRLDGMPTEDDIQAMVDNALRNTEGILSNTIQKLSNVYIDNYLTGYTKYVDEQFNNLETTISQTIINQISGDKFAQVTIAAANNQFYTTKDGSELWLVFNEDSSYNSDHNRANHPGSNPNTEAHSDFNDLDDFLLDGLQSDEITKILNCFNSLSEEEKGDYLPNGQSVWPNEDDYDTVSDYKAACLKIISYDPAYKEFLSVCQKVFKTFAKEVATIVATVGDGYSETDIINKAFGEHGEEIIASITSWANTYGSGILLNADQIILDANHKLTLTSENCSISATDNITIDAPNFKVNVDGDGGVEVRGKITATSLTIEGTGGSKSLKDFIKGVGHDEGWDENGGGESGGGSDPEPYDDSWLTNAFQKVTAEDGILLTGNIFVGNSEGNVTAGMMGASTSGDDLRFWSGSNFNNRNNAAFRVYESGKVVANNIELNTTGGKTYIGSDGILHANGAVISGDITANAVETSGNGMNTKLGNGILKIYNGSTDNERNLRAAFGLESDGYVVLKFYDNNGEEMYDLGPNGITRLGEKVDLPEIEQYETRKMTSKPQVNDNFQYSTLTTKQMVYLYKDGRKITSVGQNQVIQYWDPISKSYRNEHSIFNEKWLKTANPTSEADLFTTSLSTTQYYVVAPWQWEQDSDETTNTTKAGLFILNKNTGTTLGYIKIYSEDSPSTGIITEVYPSDL